MQKVTRTTTRITTTFKLLERDARVQKIAFLRENKCLPPPHVSLDEHDEELVCKRDVVAGVVPVPHGQEDERAQLAEVLVAQEPEPLVDVAEHPRVGVDVEGLDEVLELLARLELEHVDVGGAVPLGPAGLLVAAVVAQPGDDAGALGQQPRGDVLGQDDLDPHVEVEAALDERGGGEVGRLNPALGKLATKEGR